MKATALEPHSKRKPRYALRAFVWGTVIAAMFVVPSMIMDNGMYLYYGDYNCQVIPFYQIMHEAIRNGEFGWNWYTDLGTSLVGGYGYYSLGSPFFWIMIPFPVDWVPYFMGPLTILKFALSSLNAYIFLKRYTKDKNNAVIGAMLYAFSGFAIYDLVFHFMDVLVFFPLLMAALDSCVFEKKRGRFALMVAVCAVVNYYFFVAEVVFCLIYCVVRMTTKSFKMELKEVFYLIFEAVMGIGMALFMLLPSLYQIIGNTRVNDGGMTGWQLWVYENVYMYVQIIMGFFVPPELASQNIYVTDYSSQWLSITSYLPLFSMAGVFAIIFNKRRNKWMRVFYAVCTVFMFVPILNSSFQMFTEAKYVRWFFMLLLIMSLGSVMALEDPATNWKKSISANLVGVVLIAMMIGFTPLKSVNSDGISEIQIGLAGANSYFWTYIAVSVLNIALCVLFVSLYKKNKTAFKRFGALLTSVAILSMTASTVVFGKVSGDELSNPVDMNLLNCGDNLDIPDIQQWRSDTITTSNYADIRYDYDTIESADYATAESMANGTLDSILKNTDKTIPYENDNLTMYWRIPGFECFHSTVSGSSMDFFNKLGFDRTTMSNWSTAMYGFRSFFSVKYLFNFEGSVLSFTDEDGETIMPGWKYIDTQNGYDIYENENCLPMGFTYDKYITSTDFQNIPIQFRHLALLDAMVVDSINDMFECTAAGMQQVFPEDFDYTEEAYYKHCEERKAISCYEFERDSKGFQAKIDTGDEEKYVFFSVPYEDGWTATVNGQSVEILRANYGFMAVKVPANTTSTIRFNFHTPGIVYGAVVAVVCLLLLIIYLAAMKLQSTPPTDDGESDGDEPKDGSNDSPKDNNDSDTKSPADETDEEDISLFDIVKQTEEQNMMHTFNRVQVALERGYGSVAYDINDKKYIDFTSGVGVNALGYADSKWSDAVEKQMREIPHASNLYYNIPQIQLAEILCMKTGFSKVFFANSGAEANECAIKLARKYGSDKYGNKHTHIVTLENSFHGRTITTLSATGQDVFHQHFYPFTEGFSYARANDMESIKDAVTENTCAVMIELVQGEGGVNPLDKEFVVQLSQFCAENDILLMVDEIQTGIGRTGKLFCYENFGIKPDVITSAKALGGGLPLSACMCSEKLADVMTPGTNGTTFGGNPIACAGALRILDIVSDEEFLGGVRERGDYMRHRIESMKGVKSVRGLGMMIGIELENDNTEKVLAKCAENGLLVLTAKGVIRLLPPLNIDYIDLDEGLDILEETISQSL